MIAQKEKTQIKKNPQNFWFFRSCPLQSSLYIIFLFSSSDNLKKKKIFLPLLLSLSSKSGGVCSVYRTCLFSFFLLIRLTIENEEVRTGESGMIPFSTSTACCFCSLETKSGGQIKPQVMKMKSFHFSKQDNHTAQECNNFRNTATSITSHCKKVILQPSF